MTSKEEKYYRRKINGSYITSVISITLVLFTLGFLGLIILHANNLSDYIKENIGFEIILKPGTKEADIVHMQKMLDVETFVKSTEYITREEAAKRLSEALGEDFIGFLGEENNPLLPSLDVRFRANWANNDSLAIIEQNILSNENVKEVYYQKSLVHLINKNIRKISIVLLAFSALLLLIATALINNTIRISVYSKRFVIRSMQLVGATESFIRRPFVLRGMAQGILSAVIALFLISGIMATIKQNIPELELISSLELMAFLYAVVLLLGLLVSGVSTLFAVSRYLNLKPDKLYG
jgi:cell division transport system permease protein